MIRLLPWLMLLPHIPGVCAPGESDDDHSPDAHRSDDRVREHLLGAAANRVTEARERMVAALGREANDRAAQVLAWAVREAIERAPVATDFLRATVDEVRQAAVRKTRKGIR